jgi:co-chaperonin GroES (HSP10)
MRKAGINWVVVKVDERLQTTIKGESLELVLDPTYEVQKNTKIKAEVVMVPSKVGASVLYEDHQGYPLPARRTDEGRRYPNRNLSRMVTVKDPTPEIAEGDTIYFHYLSLIDNNYIGKEDGMELYRVAYDQVFCRVRNGEITMLNGFVAVTAKWDETYEDISFEDEMGIRQDLRVKQTKTGIIYDINEEQVFRHGKLEHRGSSPDGKDYNVFPGDKIIYTDFSEFKNKIEDVEYYIMKLWDIVAVYRKNTMEPMADYVFIDVTPVGSSGLIIPDKYQRPADEGKVLAVGTEVKEIKKDREVRFDVSRKMDVELEGTNKKGTFIREPFIFLQS